MELTKIAVYNSSAYDTVSKGIDPAYYGRLMHTAHSIVDQDGDPMLLVITDKGFISPVWVGYIRILDLE